MTSEAFAPPSDPSTPATRQVRPVLDGLGWTYDPAILDDARDQARPFHGDETAHDRAWAARVDTAFHSMDVVDPAGLDAWIESHAQADEPYLAEAALVAVWETRVRELFDDASADVAECPTSEAVLDDGDGLP